MSSKMTIIDLPKYGGNTLPISVINVERALAKPNGINKNSKCQNLALKAVFGISTRRMYT